MVIDGDGTTFKFDGTNVEGVEEFRLFEGQPRDVAHRPLSGAAVSWRPGQPDYGRITLTLYRDDDDAGQTKLRQSLSQRLIRDCVLETKDGTTRTFRAYCRVFPLATSINGVNRAQVSLQIDGEVS